MFSAEIQQFSILAPMITHTDDSRDAVAARLKRAREILNLSKKEFAERAGISMQTYGPFENGHRDLSLQSAKLLRKTYGLTLEYLYFGNIEDLPTRISRHL